MKKICCQTLIVLCIISLMNINLFANAKSKEFAGYITIHAKADPPFFSSEAYPFEFETEAEDKGNFISIIEVNDNISEYEEVFLGQSAAKEEYHEINLLPYNFTGFVEHTYIKNVDKTYWEEEYIYSGDWETSELYDKSALDENIKRCNYAIITTNAIIHTGEKIYKENEENLSNIEDNIKNINSKIEELEKNKAGYEIWMQQVKDDNFSDSERVLNNIKQWLQATTTALAEEQEELQKEQNKYNEIQQKIENTLMVKEFNSDILIEASTLLKDIIN